jgi:hypothetical protein
MIAFPRARCYALGRVEPVRHSRLGNRSAAVDGRLAPDGVPLYYGLVPVCIRGRLEIAVGVRVLCLTGVN